jgi:hypothetical protein
MDTSLSPTLPSLGRGNRDSRVRIGGEYGANGLVGVKRGEGISTISVCLPEIPSDTLPVVAGVQK